MRCHQRPDRQHLSAAALAAAAIVGAVALPASTADHARRSQVFSGKSRPDLVNCLSPVRALGGDRAPAGAVLAQSRCRGRGSVDEEPPLRPPGIEDESADSGADAIRAELDWDLRRRLAPSAPEYCAALLRRSTTRLKRRTPSWRGLGGRPQRDDHARRRQEQEQLTEGAWGRCIRPQARSVVSRTSRQCGVSRSCP